MLEFIKDAWEDSKILTILMGIIVLLGIALIVLLVVAIATGNTEFSEGHIRTFRMIGNVPTWF